MKIALLILLLATNSVSIDIGRTVIQLKLTYKIKKSDIKPFNYVCKHEGFNKYFYINNKTKKCLIVVYVNKKIKYKKLMQLIRKYRLPQISSYSLPGYQEYTSDRYNLIYTKKVIIITSEKEPYQCGLSIRQIISLFK